MAPKSRRLKSPYPTPRAGPDIKVVLTMFIRKRINSKYLPLLQTGYTGVTQTLNTFLGLRLRRILREKEKKKRKKKRTYRYGMFLQLITSKRFADSGINKHQTRAPRGLTYLRKDFCVFFL